MQILDFVFSSFWTWAGTFLIVCAASQWRLFTVKVATAVDQSNKPKPDNKQPRG